jgi:DNA-binding transcriptional MerR regulator
MDALTIGQLARTTDTNIETIRYYEEIGLRATGYCRKCVNC